MVSKSFLYYDFFFVFSGGGTSIWVLGIEPGASYLLGKHSTTELYS